MWRRLILVLSIAFSTLGLASAASAGPAASSPAGGTVGTGPGTCDEAALTTALAGGGSVTFNCGGPATILILSSQAITQPTTIDGGGQITITGGLATRLFDVAGGASLELKNIVLDGGAVNGFDGGAIANAGSLRLDHTTIQYSQTDTAHSGGAIFSTGPVFMRDSQLLHNHAGSAGALFANFANAKVVIEVTDFGYNTALSTAGRGGAIWVGQDAEVSIWLSSLFNNVSEGDGGAVYNQGLLTTSETAYVGNRTTVDPLATSRGFGGALASIGPLTMTHDIFYLNSGRFGGGLFAGGTHSQAPMQIRRGLFLGNKALYAGGGLYTSAPDDTHLTVADSFFQGNLADTGGGLARSNTPLTIFRSAFGQNLANTGGGLSNSAGPSSDFSLHIYDSTFYSNVVTTTQGGAIYNTALMDLHNLTLEGNKSGVANVGANDVMQMSNTVLHSVGLNCDGDGTLPQSQGGNFSTDTSCGLISTGDAQGPALNPLLGPISTTTSGVTYYFVPLPGSPLINTAAAACSEQDQRGAYRLDACDRGAIEAGGALGRLFVPLLLRRP